MTQKANFNHFAGSVVSAPFDGVDPASTLQIEHGLCPIFPAGMHLIENLAIYEGALLSVHFSTDTWSTVEGSAIMVAPGIAIAAAHVIEPLLDHIMKPELQISCTGLAASGLRHWPVRNITKVNGSDLMILALEYGSQLPTDRRFMQATLSTRLPAIGEPISIAGFRSSDEPVPAEEGVYFPLEAGHLTYGVELRTSVGKVTQHYLDGRDSTLPGPVIEVACSTVGGMSGGPAFDRTGKVVGVLSKSFDQPDGLGPSQVSLLWPALVQTFTPAFLPHWFSEKPVLLHLDSKLCGIDRRDAISFTINPETGAIRLEVTTWT